MKLANRYVVFLAVASFAGGPALADDDSREAKRLLEAKQILPLESIMKKSMELYPGSRVIETEFDDDSARYTYELEIVDVNGVVWEVEFDAKTGEVLEREQDD